MDNMAIMTLEMLEAVAFKSFPLFNLHRGNFSHAACKDCCCEIGCCGYT